MFLVQLLLGQCGVSCSIIVGDNVVFLVPLLLVGMRCFLFNYCWRNVVFLVQLLLG